MTVEEKRNMLKSYCRERDCDDCSVVERCHTSNGCFNSHVSDEEVNKNYEIVFGNEENDPAIDPVNRPAHYTDGKIEVIDYIEDKKLGFCLGNAIKYISRAGKKNPDKEVEDLNKAIWYIKRRIKEIEEAIV